MKKIVLIVLCITVSVQPLCSYTATAQSSTKQTMSQLISNHKGLIGLGILAGTLGFVFLKNQSSKKSEVKFRRKLRKKKEKFERLQKQQADAKGRRRRRKLTFSEIRAQREKGLAYMDNELKRIEDEEAERRRVALLLRVDSLENVFGVLGLDNNASVTDIESKSKVLIEQWEADMAVVKAIEEAARNCQYLKRQETRHHKNDDRVVKL